MPGPAEIVLLSPAITPRIKYIIRLISARLGCNITLISTEDINAVKYPSTAVILQYGPEPVKDRYSLFSSGLMLETGIYPHDSGVFRQDGHPFLYPAPLGFDLPFDLFSACFFLLSRYEEYLPFKPDRYGRFEAGQSLAFRNGFLEEPVIDQWIILFGKSLQKKFPELSFSKRNYRFISTFDIDNPWAFLHKGFFRNISGGIKALWQGRYTDLRQRLGVLKGAVKDPFDTYEYIRGIESKYHFTSVFFFLLGGYGRLDPNYACRKRQFRELVRQIGDSHRTGIHPSFRSNHQGSYLKTEYKLFSTISGRSPDISRQHFLVIRFPDTYRRLAEMGIKEDYSLGYVSYPGFRAGTSSPFTYYDLAAEYETELVIFPFAVMDVTLRQYMSLTPQEALDRIKKISRQVKLAGGTFVTLWHNESLSGQGIWKGWREVFEGMIEEVTRDE